MEYRKHVFTPHEKKLFLDIVRKYKKIVENRQTDGSTIKGKHAAWDQITCEYNASTMTIAQASSKQLRRLWTNMRQRQREALVRGRQNGTANRQPSTDLFTDITVINSTTNMDPINPGDIKQEGCNPKQLSATSLTLPPRCSALPNPPPSPPMLSVPPPQPPLPPRATLTPHIAQIQRLSVHGRDKPLESAYLPSRERSFVEKEFDYKKKHAVEIHELEMELLKEKIKEARANAELAEFYLKAAKKGIFPGNPNNFYLRLTRLNDVVCVKYSLDNATWSLLRLCPFRGPSVAGLVACTPQRGGLEVTFSGLRVTSPATDVLHSN